MVQASSIRARRRYRARIAAACRRVSRVAGSPRAAWHRSAHKKGERRRIVAGRPIHVLVSGDGRTTNGSLAARPASIASRAAM
jgi:hypothetical protein